jgi:DNA-binding response OmpR family regulator
MGFFAFFILPIILSALWFTVLKDTTYTDWFHLAKVYSSTAGCLGFWLIRHVKMTNKKTGEEWRLADKKWALWFPPIILSINILEAVIRDFEIGMNYWGGGVLTDGAMFVLGGPWNYMNGIAGILNMIAITGAMGIVIKRVTAKDGSRDMLWPDMLWFWIIPYDLWNFAYTYNCLPRIDGWTVCRTTRSLSNIPIIILTARAHEEDRLMGFELGADDYVTKPFSPRELLARSQAVLRRSRQQGESELTIWHSGPLKIDRVSHEVYINDGSVYLSAKEYDLLLYLMANANMVLSREQLLQGVWGYNYYGNLRTVDTHINRLRDKLGEYSDLIQTVRGYGYKFVNCYSQQKKPPKQHEVNHE